MSPGPAWLPPADPERVEHVRRAIDSKLGTDPAHFVFARALVEDGILDELTDEAVAEQVTAVVGDLRWKIHAIRFAKEEGTLAGPDNFYNGVITAEALAREATGGDTTPRWIDGWKDAMDWLAEYKGADGIALAEEMSTRLPEELR